MEFTLELAIYLLCSYLIGSIPTGFIAGYACKGIDIREYGSKNIGFTNVLRVLGTWPSVIVLIVDIAKGFFPVFLSVYFLKAESTDIVRILIGIVAIAGHNWTVFLNFKGGKGVNTSVGVWLAIAPKAILIVIVIWAVILYFTKYMSLSNMISSVILVGLVSYFHINSLEIIIFSVITMLLVILRHKANIHRLLKGEEAKFGEKTEIKQ